ncbi:leucine-rich repeat-containing protein 71-like [Tubulanus polymorphus]|uniref:leucine-rich repeat-containing protein 71-like n=1 Tax=Tubulanus polymorphus TaxID=672921 RepID=UPI003DA33FFF
MGKKFERVMRQTAQNSNPDEEDNKITEPHVCNGNFMNDFTELCRRNSLIVIPPVRPRPKRPPTPSIIPTHDSKDSKKGKEKQTIQELEPEPELDENGEPPEPPPKTYTVKDKFDYFKPCVQVEMDHHDKHDTVTEVFIRGWLVDEPMINVLKQCFITMDRLHSLHFWRTGFTASTVSTIAAFLPQCVNIRCLVLEGNPVTEENYWELIAADSSLQNLSLRHNGITDKGARGIGQQLGHINHSNNKIISLNLNNNRISDEGAIYISDGLRVNRTLLCLSLSNNEISDRGAEKFAQVLSRFILTHEEIVERRKLIGEKGSSLIVDHQKSATASRRGDSKDRPGSVRSGTDKSEKKRDKSSSKKKDDKKDEKTKGKKEEKNVSKKVFVLAAVTKFGLSSSSGRGSGASVTADSKTKGKDKKGGKDKKAGGGAVVAEIEQIDVSETINPLLEPVTVVNTSHLQIPGNRVLISLNLSRNNIGETGMKALLLAIQDQISLLLKTSGTGLMRLSLHKQNKCHVNSSSTYQELNEIMIARDPFHKPAVKTPDGADPDQSI